MVIKKPNTHTLGLSWHTITRQIQDQFPHVQTTTSAQQGVSLKTRSYTVRFTLRSSIPITSSWLHISWALKSSQARSKNFLWKTKKKDLGIACHTPPLKNSEESRGNAITQPWSHPIPSLNSTFLMGWNRGWIMAFLRGGVWQAIPKSSFPFFGENILLLVRYRNEVFSASPFQ